MIKLGLVLYHQMFNKEHYKFARQTGATHIVAHLTDYKNKEESTGNVDQPIGNTETGWGLAKEKEVWSFEYLSHLKNEMESYDLKLEALENISPAFWYDVLLDGPKRAEHMENVKQLIRNMGQAGIPILGYYFSLAGVSGRITGPFARGQAVSVGLDGPSEELDTPIPLGMVWNMTYDRNAPEGVLETISRAELWRRYRNFVSEIVPVAKEANVRLAAHPDDPPLEMVRKQPRLAYHPDHYIEMIDSGEGPWHSAELCLGSVAEMAEGDLYETVEYLASKNKIGYIHFRNVKDKVPYYKEAFVDDGDIDMLRILRILKKHNFDGVLIPDHTPQMSCEAPWYAGMAYAMGYMKGLLRSL